MVGTLGPLPNLGSLTKLPSIGGGTSYDYWADQRGSYSYNPFQTMVRYEPTFNPATSQYTQVPVTDFAHTFTTNEAVNGALMGNYSLIAEGVTTMAAELGGYQPSSRPPVAALANSTAAFSTPSSPSSPSSSNGLSTSMSNINALTATPATFNPGTSTTSPQVGIFLPGADGLTPSANGTNTFGIAPQAQAFLQAGGLQPYNGWGFTMLPYPGTQTIAEPAAAAASIANNVPTTVVPAVNPALSSNLVNEAAQGQFAATTNASAPIATTASAPGASLAGISALASNRSTPSASSPSSTINALESNSSGVAAPVAQPQAPVVAQPQPTVAAQAPVVANPVAPVAPETGKNQALQEAEALDAGSNAGIKALTDGASSKASSIWKAYKAVLAEPGNRTKAQAEAEEAASGTSAGSGKSAKSSSGGDSSGGGGMAAQQSTMMNMMMMMFMMQMMSQFSKNSGGQSTAESAQMSQMMQTMMASMGGGGGGGGGGMMPTASTSTPTVAATTPTAPAPSGLAMAQAAVANNTGGTPQPAAASVAPGQVTAPAAAAPVDPKKVDVRKLQALANNSNVFTSGRTGTCVVTTEKNVRAATGMTPWSNTGTADKNNTAEAIRQALTSGKFMSVPGDRGPVAFKNDRGQVGFHTMSVQEFERKVANGEIPAGALVAQTRHGDWEDKNGAYGNDMGILTQDPKTGKMGIFNYQKNNTLRIYGDRTQSVAVLLPKAQTA